MPDPVVTPEVPAAPAEPAAPVPPAAEPAAPATPAEPTKAEVRRHKLKVDGAEVEVDDEELKRGYSLATASYKRMEQVAQLRKELDGFTEAFKKDPVSVMRRLAQGDGPQSAAFKEAVEKFLYEEYQKEKLSPQERALAEREERLTRAEREAKAREQAAEETKLQQQQAYWAKKYDEEITAALSLPDIGLPKTPTTVRRMADLMSKALKAGIDVEAKDIARMVRSELLASQKELLGGLSGADLIKYLGEDVAKKIRAHEVSQLKTQPGQRPAATPAATPAARAAPTRERITERDFDERMKRIMAGQE